MARVAGVDHQVSGEEKHVMREIIKSEWNLSDEHAQLVVDISHHRVFRGLDGVRLIKRFNDLTALSERRDFLRCLFAVLMRLIRRRLRKLRKSGALPQAWS
jgi:uncharacterized tellurite resistance protein B-like protein